MVKNLNEKIKLKKVKTQNKKVKTIDSLLKIFEKRTVSSNKALRA